MGLKLCVVGTFYPEHNFAGNSTTPLTVGLADLDNVERVVVYCQVGGILPQGPPTEKISLRPIWRHGSAASIAFATMHLLRRAHEFDAIVFNTYVTAYGRSVAANAIGMLAPAVVSRVSRKPTSVYMHNLVETQDVEKLGYHPSGAARAGARILERSLLENTRVFVPLASQAIEVEKALGRRPEDLFFPFLESYLLLKNPPDGLDPGSRPQNLKKKILLLGTWGPQKDLAGALEALDRLIARGLNVEVTLAGSDNKHFAGYLESFNFAAYTHLKGRLHLVGELSDARLVSTFNEHDLLLLPYNATGGYSGALNLAAGMRIPVIAYRTPQLVEQAVMLGLPIVFVDPNELEYAISTMLQEAESNKTPPPNWQREVMNETERALRRFLSLIEKG